MPDNGSSSSSQGPLLGLVRTLTPRFVRERFTLKFALILIAMGLVIGTIGIVATQTVAAQMEDNVEQEYSDLATQQAGVVQTWVQRNAIAVKVTSENGALTGTGSGELQEAKQYLSRTSGNLYDMQSISVIRQSSGSTRIVTSPQLPDGQTLSGTDREWLSLIDLSDMSVGGTRVTDVHEVDGQQVAAFISPIPDTGNRYLVVEYSTASLTDSLQPGEHGERFTRLVNAEGTVQVASDGERLFEPYGDDDAMEYARLARETSGVDSSAGPNPSVIDEPYVVSYAPIEVDGTSIDWAVLVHEPRSSAFGFVQTISQWGTIATIGGVLFIGLLGALIGLTTSRDLNRLRGKVQEMEEGNLDVEIHSDRIDSIGKLYDGFASMRDALDRQITEAEQARKEAEVSRAEAMELSRYLQETAEEYSAILEECANGDLTQRMEPHGENDAMDRIATDFNEMIDELENTTGQLRHFADEVERAGESVETSAESVRDASEQVAESIQRISDDAHRQRERLDELTTTIDEVLDRLEGVARASDADLQPALDQLREVTETIDELAESIDVTMAESENVAGAAEEQTAELTEVSQQAQDLTRYAGPLKDVLDSFDTESKHEFYFPTGPGSPQVSEEQ